MTEPENKSVLLGNNPVTMFGITTSKRRFPPYNDQDNDGPPVSKKPRIN